MAANSERKAADAVDSILVMATVKVESRAKLPDAAVTVAERIHERPDGHVVVRIGSIDVETNNNELRQEQLAAAVTTLWVKYTEAGFDSPSNADLVVLSFALSPEWGQAASAVEARVLKPWIDAGAELHITAYPPG